MAAFAPTIGIDVGGTKCLGVGVDENGTVVAEHRVAATRVVEPVDVVADRGDCGSPRQVLFVIDPLALDRRKEGIFFVGKDPIEIDRYQLLCTRNGRRGDACAGQDERRQQSGVLHGIPRQLWKG